MRKRSAETETWTREEVLLFESLPKDLVQFVISKHLPRIVDVENACRAFGSEQCRKWRIFRFIFYARFGKEAWEKAHARHPFVNDAWFLRAYEMTQFLLDPKHKAPLQVYVRLEQNVRDVTYTDYSALPSDDDDDDEEDDLPQVTANVTYVTRVYTREREEGWNFQVVQSTRGNIVAGNELGETDAIVLYRKIFEQDPLGPQFPSGGTFSDERLLDVSGRAPLSDTLVFSICYYFYELLRVGMSMEKATILNEETDEKTRVPNLEAPACAVCSKATAVFACGAKATCGHIYCSAECADTAWFKLGHYAHCGVGYDNLPNEILQNIMLETKVKRLSLLCLTSSRFAVICEDPRFMHQYVLRRREEEWERMVNSWVQIGRPPNYAALRKWLPYLLQHPAKWDPTSVYTVDFINLLATDGMQDLLSLILEDGRDDPTVRAMLSACKMGRLGVVLLFLQDGRLDPGEEDDDDEGFEEYPTAFQSAAAFGHADIVNALLQDGRADPSANNGAALFFASQKGHVNVMDALLADARVSPVQNDFSPALDDAIFGGRTNVVRRLLQDQRVIDMIQNVQGIVVTAVEENQLDILKLLLEVPTINPAELDNAGMHIACEKDLVDIVSLLMRYYPATSPFVAKEEGEYSAFEMAVLKGSAKVVALLLKHPDVPIGAFNAIDLVFDNASRIVMFPVIEVLIEDGRTPLEQRHLSFAIEHHIVNVAIAFLADARLQSEAILEQALVEAQGENLSELVKVIQSIQRVQGGVQKQRKLVKTRI